MPQSIFLLATFLALVVTSTASPRPPFSATWEADLNLTVTITATSTQTRTVTVDAAAAATTRPGRGGAGAAHPSVTTITVPALVITKTVTPITTKVPVTIFTSHKTETVYLVKGNKHQESSGSTNIDTRQGLLALNAPDLSSEYFLAPSGNIEDSDTSSSPKTLVVPISRIPVTTIPWPAHRRPHGPHSKQQDPLNKTRPATAHPDTTSPLNNTTRLPISTLASKPTAVANNTTANDHDECDEMTELLYSTIISTTVYPCNILTAEQTTLYPDENTTPTGILSVNIINSTAINAGVGDPTNVGTGGISPTLSWGVM
ncbi:hypothetical protein B0H66DRAFT_534062 [Apodospora peruviana]|uniref:Uncharacterized protein n=1 Tax=Apodospora peruviana TaxID=516989 RepID=A0AAE0HZS4_9PEZI|nr:hypothetical protein B0H66DRAFT_534062 [Apodospora peruviana]